VTNSWNDTAKVIHQVLPAFFDSVYVPSDEVKRYRFSEYNNQAAYGSGNVISTVEDMLKFDSTFFAGKLLKQSSMDEALTPLRLNNGKVYEDHMDTMWGEGRGSYGLGWEIFQQPGYGKAVGHGGFKFGIATFYYRSLERKQTIITYVNGESDFGSVVMSCFNLLNGKPTMPLSIKKSVVRAYARALISGGADHAASLFHLYRADTVHYYFSDKEMNFLGYDFLYQAAFKDHQRLSLETFKLNMFMNPSDYNVYDSYGEALMEAGDRQDAILMYKRSLELNPGNEGGIKALKKLNAL
jgi:tetratricopeptide (TPR) repeat protein